MCFIERETLKFILKFSKILSWTETVLRDHVMKSDKKLFFNQNFVLFCFENMEHVVIDRYFSLFLKGLKIFLYPGLSSVASPICQVGQSEITFLIFAFSSWFFLFFSLIFGKFFALRDGTLPPWPPRGYATAGAITDSPFKNDSYRPTGH